MSNDEPGAAETMGGRSARSRATFWLVVEANRLVVAALLFAALFAVLVAVGTALPNATALLERGDPVEATFESLTGATITGVTLVLTLNQLVLSQELGAVGDQRERMEEAMAFRRDAEGLLDQGVSPPEPAAFLGTLLETTREHAATLREGVDEEGESDGPLRNQVTTLAESVDRDAGHVADRLADAQFGTFEVMSAVLDFNYSLKIYRARRLRAEYSGQLSEPQETALDDLVETLELFGPAREHFKTLYFQSALIDLSRAILLAALPALLVAASMTLYFEPATVTGTVAGVPLSVLVVSAAVALALLPFLVLLAYVARIATITKRTLSIGSFLLRETDREETGDYETGLDAGNADDDG
ncbi:hypothetical protein [Haloparvum sp. PAK95]|uniref:hypothetical protein n=1 Tax=Haloparvum sp. PAK95 TaxID=3418962 RepID=UPI003D2F1BC6